MLLNIVLLSKSTYEYFKISNLKLVMMYSLSSICELGIFCRLLSITFIYEFELLLDSSSCECSYKVPYLKICHFFLFLQLGTFPGIEAPHYTVRDLSDGVAIAEVLAQM